MIRVIVSGSGGRMGSRIVHALQAEKDMKVSGALEVPNHPYIGRDIGECLGLGPLGVKVEEDLARVLKNGEVIVEFTNPQATLEHLRIAAKEGKAMVIGTTGFKEEELKEIRELTKNIPCVMAPNMSVGVNLLYKLVKDAVSVLGDSYDVEIIEAHHHFKKDAPSGTAMMLAKVIAGALNRDIEKVGIYGRKGLVGERKSEEIGLHAVRAGDIVGDHTVIFGGVGERLEIVHRAHSRDTFAQGTLRAIRYVVSAPNGLHDMGDVLGLKR